MATAKIPENVQESDFDWLQLRKDINSASLQESSKDKLIRKVRENPFVPIGCLATFSALSYGLWSFKKGERKMSQYMMRVRIGAQGFTVVALIIGIGLTATKNS